MDLTTIRIKLKILKNKYMLKKEYTKWMKEGRPNPPPHLVKRHTINEYQKKYGIQNFVETGTYLGDMIEAQKEIFDNLYSIEIQPTLFRAAKNRFSRDGNIQIFLGDSAQVLDIIMPKLNHRTIFWLDGHYSGGITGKSDTDCPIYGELSTIFSHETNHLILIDDADCFDGKGDYPTLEALSYYVESNSKSYKINIVNNIIILEN
jgi:hypothetical protein